MRVLDLLGHVALLVIPWWAAGFGVGILLGQASTPVRHQSALLVGIAWACLIAAGCWLIGVAAVTLR